LDRRRFLYASLAALFLLSIAHCLAADRALAVRQAVRAAMLESRATGCTVAIAENGNIVFQHGFGYADVENFVTMRPQTVMRIASISKAVTGVAVMRLVQQGKVDLDGDIRTYVPEFPDKGHTITPRQVLGHLSGIRAYKGNEAASRERYASVSDSLKMFVDDPLQHAPGEKYLYSTLAFTVAARMVENVTGSTFPEYLEWHVFRPAGMVSTGPEDQDGIVRWRARGYVRTKEGVLQNSPYTDISYKWAGGGLVSTAPDLCRLGMALMAGKLLDEASLQTLWTGQKTNDGRETGYGLGWSVGKLDGLKTVSHGGAQPMVRTILLLIPERKLAVSVMSNFEGFQPSALAQRITRIWLGLPAE